MSCYLDARISEKTNDYNHNISQVFKCSEMLNLILLYSWLETGYANYIVCQFIHGRHFCDFIFMHFWDWFSPYWNSLFFSKRKLKQFRRFASPEIASILLNSPQQTGWTSFAIWNFELVSYWELIEFELVRHIWHNKLIWSPSQFNCPFYKATHYNLQAFKFNCNMLWEHFIIKDIGCVSCMIMKLFLHHYFGTN